MKTLKNILLSVLLLAAYNTANAQCQIPIWASPSGPNVQFNWGYDSTNTLASWYWDFGDGDTSHSFNVEHTYAQSGVYNYCLHYTGTPCSGDTCGTVTVDVCDFNPYITYSGNYLTIAFEIYNPTAGASYSWTILDDSNNTLFTSTQPAPQFTFSGYNVYHVASVVVTLPNGCVDSSQTGFYVPNPCDAHVFHYNIDTAELAFYAWPQDSMGVTQFTYSWDFGDGTSDNTQNPTHNFGGYGTWNVCMIVTGPTCTDTVCESITLAPPPPPTPDCPSWIYLYPNGADVQFYGDLDSLNFASSFQWNFGDGNISNSPNPAHTYQSGSYIVCLNYTDSVCNVSICDSLTIDVCNFNPQFNYNTSGNTVTFAPTNPQSGSSYTWFFYSPNGALLDSSNLQNPQFTFPGYGSFPVALQVTLQNGCTDSSLTWIYFSNPCEAYISSYRIDSTSFQFYSFPFDSVNTNSFTYAWNFGDGTTDVNRDPVHDFGGYGSWNVCLTVTGQNCTDTACRTITIQTPPPPTYYISGIIKKGSLNACQGHAYLIKDSIGVLTFLGMAYTIDSGGNCPGFYYFNNVPQGQYYIKASLGYGDPDSLNFLPTYYGDVLNWGNATPVNVNQNLYNVDINLIAGVNPGGPGFIGGWVSQGAGLAIGGNAGTRGIGDPLPNIQINLVTDNDMPVAHTFTDGAGRYTFTNLALGTYKVYAEEINKVPYSLNVTLNANNPSQDNVNVSVNSNTAVTGLEDLHDIRIEGVFPNPVNDKATIVLSLKLSSKVKMNLTDVNGRLLQSKSLELNSGVNEIRLDLSGRPSGVCHLSLVSEANKKIIRLVKGF